MSSCWKSEWMSECPIFTLNRRLHSAARTFSGPPISLLTRLWFRMSFDSSRLQTNCLWIEKVRNRCLTMNLYSFVSITRHKFLSTYPIVVSKEFWRFFDAVRGFYINSAPESNRLFRGNGGCVYPLAALAVLYYCRRGNSGFQHADKSLRAIFD